MAKQAENRRFNVQVLHIDADLAGQRIDNFLLGWLKGTPRSLIYRIVRRGEVRVNMGRIKPSYRLQCGDKVRIPPLLVKEVTSVIPGKRVIEQLESYVLYEDKHLLVLDKPSGFAVHGGSGVDYGIIEALRAARSHDRYLELVHRLDQETSGCLIIAKRRSALRSLHHLFRSNRVKKHYIALVMGRWQGAKQRRIEAPLHKNRLASGERMVRINVKGKPALSIFKPLKNYANASLVEVKLETGRTHQIRVHAAYAEHPIAGDEKYGNDVFNRQMRSCNLRRLFLHAHKLAFTSPATGQTIEVTAQLPEALQTTLDMLDKVI